MELENKIEKNISTNIETEQKKFLDTFLGKTINSGIDIAIRYLLPNFLEDQVINIKNSLFENGLKDGIKTAIDAGIDLGKSVVGIATGNFENISQVKMAVENGGIIDSVSGVLGKAINLANKSGLINNSIASILKNGKNIFLENISSNLESNLTNQVEKIEKLNKYIENWNESYTNMDFEKMENEYKKMQKVLKELIPFENTLQEARKIENIHNLIKNNGHNFNLTKEQLELADKL